MAEAAFIITEMKNKLDFDKIYAERFKSYYDELAHEAEAKLSKKTGKTLLFKRNELGAQLDHNLKALTCKIITPENRTPDKYTIRLLLDFRNHIGDYDDKQVSRFINEHLERIKGSANVSDLSVPENINLSPKQTVEFIAHHEALGLFIDRLYSVGASDRLEIWKKKLNSIRHIATPVGESSFDDVIHNKDSGLSTTNLEEMIVRSVNNVLDERESPSGFAEDRPMTISEAAKYLKLAVQTIYGYTSKARIPFIKKGKRILFLKSDLDKWLMEGKQLTIEQTKRKLKGDGIL